MRKIFIAMFFASLSVAATAQTRGIEASQVTMTSKGDSVLLEMRLAISPKAVNKLQGVELIPILSDGTGEGVRFPSVVVNGSNRARIYARHEKFRYDAIVQNPPCVVVDLNRKFTGDTIAYSAGVAAPHMGAGSIRLEYILISPAGERQSYAVPVSGVSVSVASPEPAVTAPMQFPTNVAVAEVPAPLPVLPATLPAPAPTGETHAISGSASLDFATGSHLLNLDTEHNRRELSKMDETIGHIAAIGAHIVSVTVTAYSSPEGRYGPNVTLAHDRAVAFSRLLQERYGLYGGAIQVRAVGENWRELRAAVAEGRMAYRDEILAVIDSSEAPDAKESRLRRMADGVVWEKLQQDIFPHLRKVDYSIEYQSAE
jgi:hypothetical protein